MAAILSCNDVAIGHEVVVVVVIPRGKRKVMEEVMERGDRDT